MPPGPPVKGKSAKPPPSNRDQDRRSRSRNTTPLSSSTEASTHPPAPPVAPATITGESPYLHTSLSSLLVPETITIEGLIEKQSSNGPNPPSAASLNPLHDGIVSQVLAHVNARGQACDRAMRELARKRKERIEAEREREERERLIEEERKRRVIKKAVPKKRDREEMEVDETRPPAVGAHGLARQDGVDVHIEQAPASSPAPQIAATKAARDSASSPSSASETSHQPPRAMPVAHYETFGEDPTKFDDPTIYDIREITPDMTDEEKKAILCVADYPHDDLQDLTPPTPPDMDYSNAKPANQVAFTTFLAYVEPYVRPLTEEDVAFLKERGDRVEPYIMPARGSMPYREVWAREDGLNPRDPMNDHLPPNEPRGSIEDMSDDVATTEEVSSGPLLSRLLAAFRHEPNNNSYNDTNGVDADTSMLNGETTAGDQEASATNHVNDADSFKPVTFFPDISNPASRPTAASTRSFGSLEQRMLQELRYHGLLTPEATPDYDSHFDDEVAARLRYLQSELRQVAAENGARKARVLELTEERMAMQEYNTIADDLDNQLNAAYTKRNRTMSKPRKGMGKGRFGGAAGVAIKSNVVSEGVKMLMDRRLQWKDLIGPVVDFGQKGIPKETVFDRQTMERLTKLEGEAADSEDA